MKMKKLAVMLAAMAVSAFSFASVAGFSASAAATEYPDSITIMVAGGWGAYAGSWSEATADNSVTITDNGTYTIHVPSGEAGEVGEQQWAMAIRSTNFVAFDYGDEGDDFDTCIQKGGITVTVDSVKINGNEKLNGTPGQLVKDDNGNDFRVNIYNKWGNDYAIVDGTQVFDGDVEVTFTVDGLKFGQQTAETTTEAPDTTTAAGDTTTAAGNTTTAAGNTTAATTAAKASTTAAANNSASASTTAAAATTNTATGEGNGIAVAVAALTVAGGAALVSRKRK